MAMRITRKVFHDLAIWMVSFGLSIGITFPFFVMMLGMPREAALTGRFFAACLGAGALAGIINYGLARGVVGVRLRLLSESMRRVADNLLAITVSNDLSRCTPEDCSIPVDSEDEIGESAAAFNQLVAALATSMRTQSAVRSFSEMLTSQLEIGSLAEKALHQFFEHTGTSGGLILFESAGEMKVAASRGLRDPEAVAGSSHVKAAVRTGERQTILIPEDVAVEGAVVDFRPSEVIVYPVTYKHIPLGVVVLATARTFDPDHRARIDLFLQGLGLALNNALIHDRLQRLAALDPLTGIYNRRFGLGRLHEEYARAVRANTPVGILMLDIDYFKVVNDTYGHIVGDRILKSICALARSSLREGDILVRYGGDEFLAVLPAAAAEDLRLVGERLRRAAEDSVVAADGKSVHVTVSIGGAAYPGPRVETENVLIELADEALYRAKDSGRNRVEISK
jgi:diguanylate cyclase (GGDEF)-like protein